VENGTVVMRQSSFRAYKNLSSSFEDYQRFVTENPRYTQALQQGENAERYIEELHQAGYATDPQYAQKIKNILTSDQFKNAINANKQRGEF
jgi:flagellar protein FlgJ